MRTSQSATKLFFVGYMLWFDWEHACLHIGSKPGDASGYPQTPFFLIVLCLSLYFLALSRRAIIYMVYVRCPVPGTTLRGACILLLVSPYVVSVCW